MPPVQPATTAPYGGRGPRHKEEQLEGLREANKMTLTCTWQALSRKPCKKRLSPLPARPEPSAHEPATAAAPEPKTAPVQARAKGRPMGTGRRSRSPAGAGHRPEARCPALARPDALWGPWTAATAQPKPKPSGGPEHLTHPPQLLETG